MASLKPYIRLSGLDTPNLKPLGKTPESSCVIQNSERISNSSMKSEKTSLSKPKIKAKIRTPKSPILSQSASNLK